jgi:outer membrane protein TolC
MNNLSEHSVKKHSIRFILLFIITGFSLTGTAQVQALNFTLDDVISLAREQSPMGIMARHRFRGSYWEYRTHKAKFRPSLTLRGTMPDLDRSIDIVTLPDGNDAFVERSQATYNITASLQQNIAPTGGSIFMSSGMRRIDLLRSDQTTSTYSSTPVSIGIRQPIKAHNSFRWERKIEPLKYEAAQKNYVESLEQVSLRAVDYFFGLTLAQVNLQIAELNYANNDTLYQIAKGRYNIGTIAENELLQLELAFLTSSTDLNEAGIQLEISRFRLRSFLGYNENVNIELIIPVEIPDMEVDVAKALEQAHANNPEIIDLQRQLLEADASVAQAKAERGLQADLFAQFGLTQRSPTIANVYQNTQDWERLQIGLEVPILDWGLAKGQFKMAQSNQEVTRTNVLQDEIDFDQNVMLQVMQFNLQDDQLRIAAKSDTVAQLMYNVTKQRFYIGKIDVTDLNLALKDRDSATRSYLTALQNYWNYFFQIRRLTLYDFQRDLPLNEDFESLIE